jgi:hypothetical protein
MRRTTSYPGAVGIDFVAKGLERADHDRVLVPLPDAQRRPPAPVADAAGEHLVEREVHAGRDGLLVHDLPVEVAPARGRDEGPAHRGADGLGREAQQLRALGERCAHGGGDGGDVRLDRESVHGGVDVGERVVRLEEEVAREVEVCDPAVALLEVDDHELPTGHLVFAVHAFSLLGGCGAAGRGQDVRRARRSACRATPAGRRGRPPA